MLLAALTLAATPDFSVRLWEALSTDNGNVVVSPTSVEACLGLLISGVGPSSRTPLAKTLGTTASNLDAYQSSLQKRLKEMVGAEATISNAGFFSDRPKPAYVAAVAKGYDATVERLLPGNGGVQQVNGWANEKTKGRIPKLFDRLDPQTFAVLVNAVTFDGDWISAFSKEATKKADFATPTGPRPVDTMRIAEFKGAYGEGKGFRLVHLPYKGGRYRMTILLPDQGDPASLLRSVGWRAVSTDSRTVDLTLPKFTVRSTPDVQVALGKMGLAPLYHKLDFSHAVAGGGAIDQIVHRTYVKVDETGTEAAAATGIAMTRSARVPQKPVVFHVDRPFAFAIQQVETGEILFEGVIREP